MGFVRRTMRFGGGLVLGGAVSTAISVLLAPRSGPELQGELKDRAEEARRAGEEAEVLEMERLKHEYRRAVADPYALTGLYPHPALADPAERERNKEAKKAQKELEKRRKEEEKADKQLQKAQKELEKAREQEAKTDQQLIEAERNIDTRTLARKE